MVVLTSLVTVFALGHKVGTVQQHVDERLKLLEDRLLVQENTLRKELENQNAELVKRTEDRWKKSDQRWWCVNAELLNEKIGFRCGKLD